ncbi:hypothetical protein J7L02_02235 [Candidatus Woesearchaeota archaeon]|nr:hypothetical protein [Candidatus Woesearchaeota archaeon]
MAEIEDRAVSEFGFAADLRIFQKDLRREELDWSEFLKHIQDPELKKRLEDFLKNTEGIEGVLLRMIEIVATKTAKLLEELNSRLQQVENRIEK